MTKGLYILHPDAYDRIYGPAERQDIAGLVEIYTEPQTLDRVKANPSVLADAEVILSGWGGPHVDKQFLAAAPKLKAVFYGAGSIRGIVSEAFWDRGIIITCAVSANAIAVAEYILSQILFSLKSGWRHVMAIKARRREGWKQLPLPGAYNSVVGLVSLGTIGRRVCELLRPFEVEVIACTRFTTAETVRSLGAERCPLDEIFRRADVVSLHTPSLPETRGMITGEHFASMKNNSTFINTARGTVVRQDEMIDVLKKRPDLWAILDVTDPEPPAADSPLYTLPNVILTPHIAGSLDAECRRHGRYMVEELRRYLSGRPLRWRIDRQRARIMA